MQPHIYPPTPAHTGCAGDQPKLRVGWGWALTPDLEVAVQMAGALDAPERVPTGGVRALLFDGPHLTRPFSLLVASAPREPQSVEVLS